MAGLSVVLMVGLNGKGKAIRSMRWVITGNAGVGG